MPQLTFRRAARRFLAGALLGLAGAAQCAAPQVGQQAPGYYRMMLGAFEVTALSDGTVDLELGKLLTNIAPPRVAKALARNHLKDPVETSVNGYLVNTGSKLVLVDAGAAGLFGPTLGKLVANLKAAGYQPDEVDAVLITHMHPDHVGGLLGADGQPAFPNATVHADRRETAFWLSAENLAKAPADSKGFFQGAQAALAPYQQAGRLATFDGDTELFPGIRARAARGHTAGHAIYAVESQGQKLLLWGDLMHAAAVQFADPSVTIRFDTDSKAAAEQRKRAYASAAREGHWVAGAHLAFPGIGHVRTQGKGYVFIPANYQRAR